VTSVQPISTNTVVITDIVNSDGPISYLLRRHGTAWQITDA
jgi:hypothetical protein